ARRCVSRHLQRGRGDARRRPRSRGVEATRRRCALQRETSRTRARRGGMMSAIEAAIEPYTTSYMTACNACGENFDSLHTRWGECLVPLRTLKCAHCESCFCQAPLPYKRSFWMNAPLELRQDPC